MDTSSHSNRTYYRVQASDRDVNLLLDPEHQTSTSYNTDEAVPGVSVCDTPEELATYLAQTGIPFEPDWVIVAVEADQADHRDEDHHLGARLVYPTAVVAVECIVESGMLDMIAAEFDALAA